VVRKSVWLGRPLGLDKVRKQAELMEIETKRFYSRAASLSKDASIRQLLGDLAAEESRHEAHAEQLETAYAASGAGQTEHEAASPVHPADRPARPCGIDGRVSFNPGATTLPPLQPMPVWPTFLVGLAAAFGAGISMGFAEALSDTAP
jgi:hypothetical protein